MRIPIIDDLDLSADDLPYTITSAVLYRLRIDSFNELPKDKRPPRDLWDKPHKLDDFMDEVFSRDSTDKKTEFIEYNPDDIE